MSICCRSFAPGAKVVPYIFYIRFADGAQYRIFLADVAYLHFRGKALSYRRGERDCEEAVAVQLFAYDAGAQCVCVEAGHQVKHRRAVARFYDALVLVVAQQLFRHEK